MLIFVVLAIFAIAAMITLILDGGAIMSNRRTAQAAADAGALAGAQRVCYGYSDGEAVATHYAMEKNGATSVNVSIVDSVVYVEATVESESFFCQNLWHGHFDSHSRCLLGMLWPDGEVCYPPGLELSGTFRWWRVTRFTLPR